VWQGADSNQEKNYRNQIQPNHYLRNIASVRTETLDTFNYLFAPKPNFKVCILQNTGMPCQERISILLICGNKFVNLQKLLQQNNVQQVVLNGDVNPQKKRALKKILQKFKIPHHDVTENGAFELSL
jgi:hypothetical protein